MIEQWRPGWWFLDLFLAIKVCSKLTFCLKPTTTVSQRVSGCTSLTDHAVNYPYTVWSVIKVLLRTYWKPAVERFRQKSPNKLVFSAENPRPTVSSSFLLFHHWRTTRYSLPGRGKFNYLWAISLGHPVFLRRILYFDRPCKGAR